MKTVSTLLAALCVAAFAFASDKAKTSDEEMQKMMEAWAKYASPSQGHEMLARFAGEWDVLSKWRSAKGAEPMKSNATNSAKLILGGRFVQSDFRGEMMGKPFAGIGLEGYDNFKKKYMMVWLDESSTAMFTAEGTADPSGKVITYMGKHDDPMTGQFNLDVKYVATWVNENKLQFEIIEKPGTSDEYTALELMYTRKNMPSSR